MITKTQRTPTTSTTSLLFPRDYLIRIHKDTPLPLSYLSITLKLGRRHKVDIVRQVS